MADPILIPLTGSLTIEAAADGRKGPRRFEMLAYSGGPLRVANFHLPVVVDLAGMQTRTKQLPIYFGHHDGSDGSRLVGHAESINKSGGQLSASGAVSAVNDYSRQVLEAHDNGYQWQASIGAVPDQSRLHEYGPGEVVNVNGQSISGPVYVARSSILRHIAVLPEGADASTSLAIAAQQSKGKESNMSTDNTPSFDPNLQPTWENPALSNSQRIMARWDAAQFAEPAIKAEMQPQLHAALGNSISFADFDRLLLRAELRDSRLKATRDERPRAPAAHTRQDAGERSTEIIEAAFALSAGLPNREKYYKPEILEASDRAYRGGIGLGELLLLCARQGGYSGRDALRAGNLRPVLEASFSTHTITTLLSSTGNKFLLDGFNNTEQVWRAISRPKPVSNFKEYTSYRLTSSLEFEEVGPAGEIPHGTMSQESYTNQAKTYAKMLTLTRTDIINDDLSAFDDLRNRLGRGAGLKLNSVFWAAFLDNASFFTSARANLQTGADTALAENGIALAAAEKLFLDLSDDDGHPLGIEPALLLTPTALSVTARKLYVSAEMRDTTASTTYQVANLFFNRFKPLTSAYIGAGATNGSDTHWFLIANPANVPLMEVAFLDANEVPTIETADADFNTLGISTRGFYDFGVARAEWRAGVKSSGAA